MKIEVKEHNDEVPANALKIGEFGISIQTNSIILRAFGCFVCLNHPHLSWNNDCAIKVRRLSPGTIITITI